MAASTAASEDPGRDRLLTGRLDELDGGMIASGSCGIGFTMSLFIAGQALTGNDFGAAKVAVFAASLIAGCVGMAILWKRAPETAIAAMSDAVESGTPVGGSRETG